MTTLREAKLPHGARWKEKDLALTAVNALCEIRVGDSDEFCTGKPSGLVIPMELLEWVEEVVGGVELVAADFEAEEAAEDDAGDDTG